MPDLWSNWSGSVTCQPSARFEPRDEAELGGIVRRAAGDGQRVRVAGSGHSFTPLCASTDVLLSLDHLAGIESVDVTAGRAWIRAGCKIHDLGAPLAERGWSLANQGDVDVQALAGAISTGTHGTGCTLGSLSTQVTALRLVGADGAVFTISRDTDAQTMRAAALSLGALGVITAVELQLVPSYRLHEVVAREPLDECLDALASRIAANRHFEFFWYPTDDLAFTKTLNPTQRPVSALADDLPGAVGSGQPRQRVDAAWRIFPTVRENRFNEMEYSLPAERGVECFLEVRALMRSKHAGVAWPVEYRTVAADELFLSPATGRATVAISIHQGVGLPHAEFFADAEAIFRRHEGRPHWAKMHSLTSPDLERLYPDWQLFQEVRTGLDPDGRFRNEHLDLLFLPGAR